MCVHLRHRRKPRGLWGKDRDGQEPGYRGSWGGCCSMWVFILSELKSHWWFLSREVMQYDFYSSVENENSSQEAR